MPPVRKTIPIEGHHLQIQVTDDHSRTFVDPIHRTAYHSASGAVSETRHVYLNNSGVAARLRRQLPTSVLEIGLGTGLGLLITLDAAIGAGASLNYTAIENDWLPADLLRRLDLHQTLSRPALVDEFLQWRASLGPSVPRGNYTWQPETDQRVTVVAADALQVDFTTHTPYDAIYFDPFAPDANPRLWTPEFLASMHAALKQGGTLVTYCVNRQVRDAMTSIGFQVQRVPGPQKGKREVMRSFKGEG